MKTFKKHQRIIATFLLLIFFPTVFPTNLFASNNGPTAPEATAFEPVDAADMVDLVTGDVNYVLPLINVPSPEGGYPLSLSHHEGIAMDQEATWVGLGWSLNPGAINRSVNGFPDDWAKTDQSNFFYDHGETIETYNISVGGTYNGVTLGLGASWGSHRSFSGEVTLGYGGALVTVDSQDGVKNLGIAGFNFSDDGVTYSLGDGSSYGIGIGVTTDLGSGNTSVGISYSHAGVKAKALGVSFGSDGTNFSSFISAGSRSGDVAGSSGSKYDVKFKLNYIGLDLGLYWFGFSQSTVRYSLFDINVDKISGSLYPYAYKKDETDFALTSIFNGDRILNSYYKADVFSETNVNYTCTGKDAQGYQERMTGSGSNNYLPNYDKYSVSAQGISGLIEPYVVDEMLLSQTGDFIKLVNDNSFDLGSKANFRFRNGNASFLRVNNGGFVNNGVSTTQNISNIINNLKDGNYNGLDRTGTAFNSNLSPSGDQTRTGNKMREGNNIEVFTNQQIISGNVQAFIEANGVERSSDQTFIEEPEGIGAYRITTVDGKTYHYSLPVYQYEVYSKHFNTLADENQKFLEIKKEKKFATHWLLTAITGPDYVDKNLNGKLDKEDYGYWVEFEYGKWSDGYSWRSPHNGYDNVIGSDYNSPISYSYYWGRKQVFYLDAIKTRTHTALFVKKLREDDISTVKNDYSARVSSVNNFNRDSNCITYATDQDAKHFANSGDKYYLGDGTEYVIPNVDGGPRIIKGNQTNFKYIDIPKNYSLALDRILVLKNEDVVGVNKAAGNLMNSSKGYYYNALGYESVKAILAIGYLALPNLYSKVAVLKSFDINIHQNILDVKDIEGMGLSEKVINGVSFNFDYSLAKGTPNSDNADKGRLTLNSLSFLGKKTKQVIPSYNFKYLLKDTNYNVDQIDDWGYHKSSPEAWSLNEIETPTGAKIQVEFEKDSYRRQAIVDHDLVLGRRLNPPIISHKVHTTIDQSGIQGQVITSLTKIGSDKLEIKTYLGANTNNVDAQHYYKNKEVFVEYSVGNKTFRDVYEIDDFSIDAGNYINILLRKSEDNQYHDSMPSVFYGPNDSYNEYATNSKLAVFQLQIPTDTYTSVTGYAPPNDYNSNNENYSPNGKLGGGLRVKKITVIDGVSGDVGQQMEYSYLNPYSNRISGITSYTPYKKLKNVPLLSFMPAPGVNYEYVTVSRKDKNGALLVKNEYRFNVIKPINRICSIDYSSTQNSDLESFRFSNFLKGINSVNQVAYDPSSGNGPKVISENLSIRDALSAIGTLKHVKTFNSKGMLIQSQKNNYLNFINDDSFNHNGIKENTFLRFSNASTANQMITRISKTSFSNFPIYLSSTETMDSGYLNTVYYDKFDFLTGKPLEKRFMSSDGKVYKTKEVPAYLKYPEMGSKVDNIANKNMLSQTAVNYSYILDKTSSTWKETGVGITTWSNLWTYQDIMGDKFTPTNPKEKIWRKHKTFVWNGVVDNKGIFQNYNSATDDGFDWTVGVGSQPIKWKQTSEVTLYDHYSMTLEARDVNNNPACTKMSYDDTKIMAAGNAGYNEMYYAGAENVTGGGFWLEPEVRMVNAIRTDEKAHTGKWSVKATDATQFGVFMRNGHRASRYKLSVWVHKDNVDKARVRWFNNDAVNTFQFNGEKYYAGDWVLLNHYIDRQFMVNTSAYFYVNSVDGTPVYFDDFMLRPVASSITGYVYNEYDELAYIIGSNGLATKFEYDAAGRLIKTYVEVIDDTNNGVTGGFKIKGLNKYNYRKLI